MSVPCELSLRKNNGRYQVAFRSVRELSELSGKITVLPRGTITAKLPFEKKATQVNLTWAHPQHGKTTLEVQNLQMVMDFTKKTLDIHNQGTGVFGGLPEKFRVTRYHSLIVDKESVPSEWQVDAVAEDGTVMGISHKTLPLYGVQFHPEAVLTEYGHEILENFCQIAESV